MSIHPKSPYTSNSLSLVLFSTPKLFPCDPSDRCDHEFHLAEGARSLSVLDSDIGSGSISLPAVTGGKSGDIALHDFRFLSTGNSKHHKISTEHDSETSPIHSTKIGNKGATTSGMIWHIPKAHLAR
jgi:hypothetical protein